MSFIDVANMIYVYKSVSIHKYIFDCKSDALVL